MKLTKTIAFLSLFLLAAGCSDDDNLSRDLSGVKQLDDYVDARDSKAYRCVQIGDQVWMVDNLEYFLPEGSGGGCYTWGQNAIDLKNIVVDKLNFIIIYKGVVNDPDHNWMKEIRVPNFQLEMMLSYYTQGMYTQEKFLETLSYYKPFHELLVQRLDEYKETTKGVLAVNSRDEAERKNGNYSQTYGYLYSLEGARKAVPEGWRLPTDADWKKLEVALGVPQNELDEVNQWRGEGCGDLLKLNGETRFEAKMAGCNAYTASGYQWIRFDECAYFWADEERLVEQSVGSTDKEELEEGAGAQTVIKEGIVRQLSIFSNRIWRGTTRLQNTEREVVYSVRCVRDAR